MSNGLSPDWLPPGWSVDLKLRKNGRKDKCYTDPSNELKFYSKPEVLRYLSSKQEIGYPAADVKNEGTSKCIEVNVVIEKSFAEELPPGWTKELKVRKQGQKVRKDPYYTDPVTGYVFRSLRDAHRYLKTGVLGKLAFKPKEDSRVDMELDDEKITGHAAPEKEKSAQERMNGQTSAHQSSKSKLVEKENSELILESIDAANCLCISENASEPYTGKENGAAGSNSLPEASGLKAKEENCESTEENELNEGKVIQHARKSSEKSKPSLPRRASKRLAGLEVDLPREPKTRRQVAASRAVDVGNNNACLATSVELDVKVVTESSSDEKQVKPSVLPHANNISNQDEPDDEIEMDNNPRQGQDGNSKTDSKPKWTKDWNCETDAMPNEKQKHHAFLPSRSLHISVGCENMKTDNTARQEPPIVSGVEIETSAMPKEGKELPSVPLKDRDGEVETANMPREVLEQPVSFPPVNFATPEESGVKIENGNLPSEKQVSPIVSPPASLSSAEEHGSKVDHENKPFEKQELPIVFPSQNLLIPEEHAGKMEFDNKADMKPELPANPSLTDFWADPCIEFAVKTLTGDLPIVDKKKVDNFPASPLDLPLGELWTDPCIEFAVKTLTGAIPVGEDLSIQDYFHQHACSSENHGENGFMLPDGGLNNFFQAEILSQPFNTPENSQNKQQEFLFPMLPNHRNGSLQHPGSTGLPQHMKGKNGQYSRPTFF